LSRLRVAVDAMGGDLAPREVAAGVVAAALESPALEVLLVGDEALVRPLVEAEPGGRGALAEGRVALLHAPEAIGMDEHPVEALRRKRRSSIGLALDAVREGRAGAFWSAGSTGACVAAASLGLKRAAGVRRPAIACAIPTRRGVSVLLDAGANVAPKAVDLLHQAAMGAAYARVVLGAAEPTVGLLNVGAEEEKGTELVREAARLLAAAAPALRYRGFVEGHDLFRGTTDVVVTDGFTGNAVLKAAEGQAELHLERFRACLLAAQGGDEGRARAALGPLARDMDWAEHGGAPLLGVEGVVLIGHGRSDARAVRTGVLAARRAAEADLAGALAAAVAALPAVAA
jgi:glycerol-3-phosphate acyltransferase PlsX